MKKILFVVGLVAITGLTRATTISSSLSTLDGNSAYSWGIAIPLASGQVVTSAEIDFTSVSLTAANSSGTGYLYTDLLNSQHTGVITATDNDAPGDYWATQFSGNNISSLGTQFFAYVGKTLTWSYILSPTQLATLNSYLAAGSFSIGIDPDCHYTVGSIAFTYTLSTPKGNVPDVATTAFLLILGLAGVEVFRRQIVGAKA